MLTFGNAPFCSACSVRGFPTFNLHNTAVFHVGRLNTQWKHINNYCLQQHCLYSNEFSSALTKHVLLCLCDRCVCISLHSLCLCLEMQKYNLPSQFSKCMTRLFDTTVNKEGFKEMKMYAQPACVCVPILEWNCGCSYFLYGHMWLHCSDMLSCPDLRLKTASSLSCGGSPTSFLTRNSYL